MQTLRINPDTMDLLRQQTANSDHWRRLDQLIEALPHSNEINDAVCQIMCDIEKQWFTLGWTCRDKPERLLELGD